MYDSDPQRVEKAGLASCVFFFRRYTEHNLIIHLNTLSFELVVNEEVYEGELELF